MEYVSEVAKTFAQHANPENAAYMKKYMKNHFDFLGIRTPVRKEIAKPYLSKDKLPPLNEIPQIAEQLWKEEAREFQYFAISMLQKVGKKAPADWIDLYESLIIKKSWWDSVDGLAGWSMGAHFEKYPDLIADYTNKWMNSGNMWLQRTCILFQLKYKEQTDFELLKSFIIPLTGSKEFFIQKAIGWALREYGKTNSQAVTTFVGNTTLAPLSRREAMRIILAG